MKLLVECAVEGVVELSDRIDITAGDLEYCFESDSGGFLRKIGVVAPINRPELFTSSVEQRAGTKPTVVSIRMDDELIDSIRRRIQALESHVAFRLPITRIRWDSAKYQLLFESEEERQAQGVYSLQIHYAGAELPKERATADNIVRSIVACDRFASLTTPLAFVREGNNEFHTFRFINAFYNFYFVLEGLYGGGEWRNQLVARSFLASAQFCRAVDYARAELEARHPRLYSQLLAEITDATEALEAAAAAKFLVAMRGRLHHFANRGKQDEPTPFSHERFKAAASLVRMIAIYAVTEEMKEIVRREEGT